ncbi:MAG: beta galactosidase jelly roll domain-containing protein [Cyclobacteriaceae bacterium]
MKNRTILTLCLALILQAAYAQLTLPNIFSDHMVIQRDQEITVWGNADPASNVAVKLGSQSAKTKADEQGKWQVNLKSMSAGGPHPLIIQSKKETISYSDILIGDVWLASGQSNMEWPLWNTQNAEEAISMANDQLIRHVYVPKNTSFKPLDDIQKTNWEVCSRETAGNFTAVGYYFAQHLRNAVDVPIGILHSSWGGTHVETWTPLSKLKDYSDFKSSVEILDKADDIELQIQKGFEKLKQQIGEIPAADAGNQSGQFEWKDADIASWTTTTVPGLWETNGLPNFDGVVWYAKSFELTDEDIQEKVQLSLGPIDDSDKTFINGHLIGETTNMYDKDRVYQIPEGVLKTGTNKIVVRVDDTGGGGGLWGSPEKLYIKTAVDEYSLAGEWQRKIGTGKLNSSIGPNAMPTLLYNAMIHPLLNYNIKGAIWYQGESNAGRSKQYATSFPAMIESWRSAWEQPDLPFYYVQLANFMAPPDKPQEHGWAELREAQLQTLNTPNTGMAVIIDIGEENDIHPRNKLDVGKRLAKIALNKDYGKEDLVFSGPLYKSHQIASNQVILSFDHIGTGLEIKDKYGYLKGFAIAGADQQFYWAKAKIKDDKVVVYSDQVAEPVAVRYGWAANPDDVNLYNKEGLPASPFRTDSWKGLTDEAKYQPGFSFE